MKRLFALLALPWAALCLRAQTPVYLNPDAPIEQRVDDALARMTTAEKIAMIHAQSKFSSPGVPRLGIPEVWCTDGPHGIRPEVKWDEWNQAGWTNDSCFAFPALSCLAATWNRDLARRYGRSLGEEARYRRKTVLLGPGVNICRMPYGGRNFEYLGEDPYLSAEMAVPYIQGVQSCGVAACVKHFALNNQEEGRNGVDVRVDERTLRELYLPAFEAAVKRGGAWAVMPAYNKFEGAYCTGNKRLLTDILKGEWAFDGVAISDWGGTHDTRQPALAGLDMEFGTGTDGLHSEWPNAYDRYYLARPYLELLQRGELPMSGLDDKVRRVLRLIFRTSLSGHQSLGSMVSAEHIDAGRRIGDEGIVLLKNSRGLLPIVASARRIVVVGENAIKMMTVGGGSSSLKAKYEVTPLEGLRRAAAERGISVEWARGYVGDPTGEYDQVKTGQNLADPRPADTLRAEAVALAKQADLVIFVGGLNKSSHQDCEGYDRRSLALPYGQDTLIAALAAANRNLVVVNISGSPVAMPWEKSVSAIVQDWYVGSEAGNALADVLFGRVNPSGKLPVTFPLSEADVPAFAQGEYPGTWTKGQMHVAYREGPFVGYRGVDKYHTKPLFAFGHGLSYTTFAYGRAQADAKQMGAGDSITVSVRIKNTGRRAGQEVVQLYLHPEQADDQTPQKQLKGFEKVALQPGESKVVSFTIKAEHLRRYDPAGKRWVVPAGRYKALVAAASNDIRSRVAFSVTGGPAF